MLASVGGVLARGQGREATMRSVLMAVALTLGLAGPPPDAAPAAGPPPAGGAPADDVLIDPQRRARVLEQWAVLAPLISMRNELTLIELDAAAVAAAFARVAQYAGMEFDAHPLLHEVGPPMVDYLIASESRVIPILRADVTPADAIADPEAAMGAVFMELMSRSMENAVLRAWQLEYDQRGRAAYRRLMPLARALAAAPSAGSAAAVEVLCGDRPLSVRNASERDLTNVTLAVELAALDGRTSPHYFYLPRWHAGEEYMLRPAVDWLDVGLWATTSCTLEVLSDQLSTPPRDVALTGNVRHAVERLLAPQVRKAPGRAIRGLAAARKLAGSDRELIARINLLREEAKDHRDRLVERLEKQLEQDQKHLAALKSGRSGGGGPRPGGPRGGQQGRNDLDKRARQMLEERIERIKAQLRELR